MDEYKNKELKEIKNDVKKDFEKHDDILIHDDREIYESGIRVIDQYITLIQNDKILRGDTENQDNDIIQLKKDFKEESVQVLIKCRNDLTNKREALKKAANWYVRLQPDYQEDLINQIALSIDTAENEVLEKILYYYRPQREGNEALAKSAKASENNGNSPFSLDIKT